MANLVAGCLLGGHFLASRAMYWDNYRLYSVFRGNNHSLNRFGEVMWWNPTTSLGFPAFYFSHLGMNTFTPLNSLVLLNSWILGRLHFYIADYTYVYIVYFTFLVPLLFSVSLYLLANQIFRKLYLRIFVIIMAAFSPGIIFNLSDNGLEQTAYGLIFAAAFLRFYEAPAKRSFLWLVAATCVAAVAFNHLALYWNLVFLPVFVATVVLLPRREIRRQLARCWAAVPRHYWAAGVLLAATCLSPAAISFSQGKDILRTKNVFQRWYPYELLKAGNPLESLTVSTPGIGFDWFPRAEGDSRWGVKSYAENPFHICYTYMGVAALPLLLVGLCFGRSPWRGRIFLMYAVFAMVIMLEGWSSVFAAVLVWPTPLRACDHFNDCTFRVGLFVLVILGSALGLEAVVAKDRVHRFALPICFAISTLLGVTLQISLHGRDLVTDPLVGYFAAASVVFAIQCFSTGQLKPERRRRRFAVGLLLFVAVDVSTMAYWHVRTFMWKAPGGLVDPSPDEIAMPLDERSFYAHTLLMLRQNHDVLAAGVKPDLFSSLPGVGLFNRVRKLRPQDAQPADLTNPSVLILDPDDSRAKEYAEFEGATDPAPPTLRSSELIGRTYNRLELRVVVDKPAILFWRDCDFPGWSATVNGSPASIVPGFWSFKTVKIPAGKSVVSFRYSQTGLFAALVLSYSVIVALIILGMAQRDGSRARAAPATEANPLRPARH